MRSLRRYIRSGYDGDGKHVCAINNTEVASITDTSQLRVYIVPMQYTDAYNLAWFTKNLSKVYLGFASPTTLYHLNDLILNPHEMSVMCVYREYGDIYAEHRYGGKRIPLPLKGATPL